MLHFASAFENSLRKDISSPLPKRHNSCKGAAHGTGNYGCFIEKECDLEKNPFQRNGSKRWSTRSTASRKVSETSFDTESVTSEVDKSPFQRNIPVRRSVKSSPVRKPEKKNASVSSENFSESDSLDSLGEKTKSSDTTDDTAKKSSDVCSRLYNNVTKSSLAKTARMRHLDIFDVDDNSWMGGLRKNTADDTEKVIRQKLIDNESPFNRSRHGSLRRKLSDQSCDSKCEDASSKAANGIQENGVSRNKNGFVRKQDSDKLNSGSTPKAPPRSSFRKKHLKFKNLSRAKHISYEEILFMSLNKKTNGFFSVVDKSNCFKEFADLLEKHIETVRFY